MALDEGVWKRFTVQEGCKGPIVAEFASVRVATSRERLPGPDVWLILRRRVGDDPDETPLSTFVRAGASIGRSRWPSRNARESWAWTSTRYGAGVPGTTT